MIQLGLMTVADIQSRTERINEPDLALVTAFNQLPQFFRFRIRVKLAPDRSMLQVILRSIEITVQSPGRHPIEQLNAFRLRPRLSVEPFDYSRQEICCLLRRHLSIVRWTGYVPDQLAGKAVTSG